MSRSVVAPQPLRTSWITGITLAAWRSCDAVRIEQIGTIGHLGRLVVLR